MIKHHRLSCHLERTTTTWSSREISHDGPARRVTVTMKTMNTFPPLVSATNNSTCLWSSRARTQRNERRAVQTEQNVRRREHAALDGRSPVAMDARPHPPSPTTPESSGESRLYVDMMSQPSRACAYFVQLCGLPVEIRAVNLGKREHKAPGYLAMNPLGQVPCLREADGFALPESSAILKYLADRHRRRVADHWYPVDLRSRARVNAALDWYHGTIRKGAAGVTWHALVAKNMGGALSRETARSMFGVLTAALETLETTWLSASPGGGPFMMGRQQPCVADLLVAEVRDATPGLERLYI